MQLPSFLNRPHFAVGTTIRLSKHFVLLALKMLKVKPKFHFKKVSIETIFETSCNMVAAHTVEVVSTAITGYIVAQIVP